ncbi:MAG: hypothetical protein AAGC60_20840 [Acidobacteriota bacterium]
MRSNIAIIRETLRAKLRHIAPRDVEEGGAIQFEIRAAIEFDEVDLSAR